MQEKHLSMAYIFHSGGLVDNITLFLNQKLNCAILISPVVRYYTSLSPEVFLRCRKKQKVILLLFKIAIYRTFINVKNKLHNGKTLWKVQEEEKALLRAIDAIIKDKSHFSILDFLERMSPYTISSHKELYPQVLAYTVRYSLDHKSHS